MGKSIELEIAPESKRAVGAAREHKWNRVAVVETAVTHLLGPKNHRVVQKTAGSQRVGPLPKCLHQVEELFRKPALGLNEVGNAGGIAIITV